MIARKDVFGAHPRSVPFPAYEQCEGGPESSMRTPPAIGVGLESAWDLILECGSAPPRRRQEPELGWFAPKGGIEGLLQSPDGGFAGEHVVHIHIGLGVGSANDAVLDDLVFRYDDFYGDEDVFLNFHGSHAEQTKSGRR